MKPAHSNNSTLRASPLNRVDLLCMLSGLLFSLLISFVFSRHRIFWEDELLGWLLLRDPSWRHMVAAWRMGADGGGFGFYLLGRVWFFLFGPSEISLRMYSAAALGMAFVVLWATLRHFYDLRVVFLALFNTWFFSTYTVVHMAEGRYYGLMVFSTALVTWLALVPTRRPGRTAAYLYPLTFLFHALLTTSHQLGVVFSASLLACTALLDRMEQRFRPGLYATGIAAWMLLWPEREAIAATARVGKPHFWTTAPSVSNFVGAYTGFSAEVACVLLALGVLVALTLRRGAPGYRDRLRSAYRARRPVWVVTAIFLLIPFAYLVEGKIGTWLFVNRYLLPLAICQVLLTAEMIAVIEWRAYVPGSVWRNPRALPVALTCFCVLMVLWVFVRLRTFVIPPENYTDALTAMLPRGVPVVCEDAWTFSELIARQHTSGVAYTFLLDWPYAISPQAPLLEVTQFHLMQNWKAVGYFGGSIRYRDEFLQQHKSFFVVRAEPEPLPAQPVIAGNPLIDRFAATPGYEVRPYGKLHRRYFQDVVDFVCVGHCPAGSTPQAGTPVQRWMPGVLRQLNH